MVTVAAVLTETGLPPDAGAFLAMGPEVRAVVVTKRAPSVVLAVGTSGQSVASVPVTRNPRPVGDSAWSGRARLAQSVRSLVWALRSRR